VSLSDYLAERERTAKAAKKNKAVNPDAILHSDILVAMVREAHAALRVIRIAACKADHNHMAIHAIARLEHLASRETE